MRDDDPSSRRIRFSCERCHRVLTAKPAIAGQFAACPKCKNPVVIPDTSTVIEPPASAKEIEFPSSAEVEALQPSPVGTTDDDELPADRRRRQQRRERDARRKLLTKLAVVAVLLPVAGVATCAARAKMRRAQDLIDKAGEVAPQTEPGKSSGERVPARVTGEPPDDWTHAEFAAYLKRRGVAVKVEGGGWAPDGEILSHIVEDSTGMRLGCLLAANPRRARDIAASRGGNAFAWGRFVVFGSGQDAFRSRVRAALD